MHRILRVVSAAALAVVIGGLPAHAATTAPTVVDAVDDNVTNNEITISHDPSNEQHLVVGWNDWNRNEGCGTSASADGGATWSSHSFIPGITRTDNAGQSYPGAGIYDFAGDPAVAFGRGGVAYFACYGYLYQSSGNGIKKVALFVNASHDGGLTWGPPAQVTSCDCSGAGVGAGSGKQGQFPDHEAITVDLWPSSPHYGRIYIAQAQFHGSGPSPITLFYSDDGTHWSKPISVSDTANDRNQDAIPFVGSDGTVYVTFDNSGGAGNKQDRVLISASRDGGATFDADHLVVNWINPVLDDLPASNYRASSYPVPGIDADGRITVAWNDRRSGQSNMWATRARAADIDTWTAPIQLKPSTHQQFFAWLDVAPISGRVDIVYYDRTLDPADTVNYVTYTKLTPAHNGLGVSASSRTVTTPPQSFDGNVATGQTTTSCGAFIGDYIGITSTESAAVAGWTGNGHPYHFDEFGRPVSCDVNQDALTARITP